MSIQVHIPFEDEAQHSFDANELELINGSGQLVDKTDPLELFYFNFSEDGSNKSIRGNKELELYGSDNTGKVENGVLNLGNSDNSFAKLENISIADGTFAFRGKFKNTDLAVSGSSVMEIASNTGNAKIQIKFYNANPNFHRVDLLVTNDAGDVSLSAQLSSTIVMGETVDIGISMRSGRVRALIDGVFVATYVPSGSHDFTDSTIYFGSQSFLAAGEKQSNYHFYDFQLLDYDAFTGGSISTEEQYSFNTEYQPMLMIAPILMDSFVSFGGDYNAANLAGGIAHQLLINSTIYYFNVISDAWEPATLSIHINTPEEISDNVSKLVIDPGIGAYVQIITLFKSVDGYRNSLISSIDLAYKFYFAQDETAKCTVYGAIVNSSGRPVSNAKIKVRGEDFFYDNVLISRNVEFVTGENGKFDLPIVETESNGQKVTILIEYLDLIDGVEELVENTYADLIIPDSPSKRFVDIVNGV